MEPKPASDSESTSSAPTPPDKPVQPDHAKPDKPAIELETPTPAPASTPPPTPASAAPASSPNSNAGEKADTTFELQDMPADTRPPRVGTPGIGASGGGASGVVIGDIEDEPAAPKWPDILAIICMVFGASGLLIHLLKFAGHLMAILGLWEKLGSPEKDEQSWFILFPNALFAIAGFFFAGILVTGGLALYRRWPWFTKWLNTWAMIKIALVLVMTLFGWAVLIVPVYHMIAGRETDPPGGWDHYWTAGRVVWSFIWLAWQLALPVFILVWLRKTHVQQTIESWE